MERERLRKVVARDVHHDPKTTCGLSWNECAIRGDKCFVEADAILAPSVPSETRVTEAQVAEWAIEFREALDQGYQADYPEGTYPDETAIFEEAVRELLRAAGLPAEGGEK